MNASPDFAARPDLSLEKAAALRHKGLIAGLDEAGCGPWAGPVVAAAVILDPARVPEELNDSKCLSQQTRERLFAQINAEAFVGVGVVAVEVIDRLNILRAALLAMRFAMNNLPKRPAAALIDGRHSPALPCPAQTVIGGDARSASIAAASIIAKVTRDRIMTELAREWPGYGWERNMGYGTREHTLALERLGITPHHRRSFAPVKRAIARHGSSQRCAE